MTNENDFKSIFDFLQVARGLQHVERFTPHPDGRRENDAEHSWSVAFICMILASRLEQEFSVRIDQAKMFKMALIHDLAEIETGDTKPWEEETRINKEEKEREGMKNLLKHLPSDISTEIMDLWEESEKRETLEAQIVKSIDRLDPVLHRTVFWMGWKGRVESAHDTVEAVDSRQLPRHAFSKVITKM